MINLSEPNFRQQEKHLNTLPTSDLRLLAEHFDKASEQYRCGGDFYSRSFSEFNHLLDRLNLIFPFDWMAWTEGRYQNTIQADTPGILR
ncbi:hypothetical protein [Telluribacter sp. SYSU D00476]|uniref:hypothetical protein n=1 Tax=Telluribacter sp. SYSU D00476 TaxID=2811430 RepID=UPI001FF6E67A|nr:hypothetical protein [Telluribacter sp. SYSU D00476]